MVAQDSVHINNYVLRRGHIVFKKEGMVVNDPMMADQVVMFIQGSKTDIVGQGCERTQFATGGDLCPVLALACWFCATNVLPSEELSSFLKLNLNAARSY